MLSEHVFPQSVVSISGKCYTCETEPAVCQLPNRAVEVVWAKQRAETNVIQPLVETNAKKVKSLKKKKDKVSEFLGPNISFFQWRKTRESVEKANVSSASVCYGLLGRQ